ncbi:MAG: HPP family protein [Thioalkalispiraceae bacterium]|jgi:CBS-domain-containing membrane protein
MQNMLEIIKRFVGISSNKTGHVEKLVSGLGGFFGIYLILLITRQFVEGTDAVLIVASMGASAVLLFAVPHGPLSQPWALVGGHLISAFIGVSCYLLIANLFVAAAVAVGLAITAMYYLRCIHPPGGATALTAVVAGAGVHELGYLYLLTPVLLNVVVILSVAIAFNYPFYWRRYPAAIMHYRLTPRQQDKARKTEPTEEVLAREDLEHALQQMNQYVDVGHEELGRIYQLARNRTNNKLSADQIKLGLYYSNGKYGSDWSVRRVVDESGNPDPERDQIIYKVVAGKGRRSSGTMKRQDFAAWAKYEVFLNENSWQRVAQQPEQQSQAAES